MYLIKRDSRKTYGGVETYFHAILTSTRDRGEWAASRPGRFPPMYPFSRGVGRLQNRFGHSGLH
jgi:hypothetical protein